MAGKMDLIAIWIETIMWSIQLTFTILFKIVNLVVTLLIETVYILIEITGLLLEALQKPPIGAGAVAGSSLGFGIIMGNPTAIQMTESAGWPVFALTSGSFSQETVEIFQQGSGTLLITAVVSLAVLTFR